ncbi:SusC/RagA family TonB-linked outer membrane protein [Proteiniphilum sp.]|nr:SusC/RagA family TonB-linked outer membrane protein [Proteiniphilum sp.]MEA4915995.1 SusC/RagA family TonB-linked outer membrane protein [Proteiniphilum sp.]
MIYLHRTLMFLMLLLLPLLVKAQHITVTGSVSDQRGEPLVGVTVLIKGSLSGTVTGADGGFSLSAPADGIIQFSYIGFISAEKPVSREFMQVMLKEDLIMMDEVVVTALGMRKEKKALAYSVTELKEDAFRVKSPGLADGLAGKVAGINVVKPTTGAMGSTRIVIRGNGSFGNNQPIYIVDGMPIDNSNYGQPGLWGGVDGGDGISSLNSDEIESMTVLKGGTAAALYGSRTANGAIVITTKKGKRGKTSVELNSSYTLDTPIVSYSDFQQEYGHGLSGTVPTSVEMAKLSGPSSWGGRLDGSNVIQFDGAERPYTNVGKNNIRNFYNNAWALNNSLSISGGSENIQYRVAFGDQRYNDLFPNSKMERNNGSINLSAQLSPKITMQAHMMYLRERVLNRQNVNDYSSNGNVLLWTLPPSIDVRTLSPAVDANGNELLLSDIYVYFANPYFVAYHRRQKDAKDRLFGTFSLQYDINSHWYLRGRAGGDMIYRRSESVTPKGTGYDKEGYMGAGSSFGGETNIEGLLGYNNNFDEEWSLDAFAGWNSMITWSESVSASGSRFIQPDFHVLGNTQTTSGGQGRSENYINSLFGQAELSYRSMLYLTLSGRNDWFSALSMKGKTTPNNIFYPSTGLGFIASEAISLPSFIPFWKIRGAWSQSGGAVGPYNLALTYGYGEAINGYPTGHINSSTIPNLNLKPLTSISYEVGTDIRFFNYRLGLDVTYYIRNTRDDIVSAQISSGSGYNNVLINAGKIENKGIELLLTGTPVKAKTFSWDASFNFSYNKSRIAHITDNVKSFIVATSRTGAAGDEGSPAFIYQEVGEPYGIIKGYSFQRDENGEIIFDRNGFPRKGEIKKLGVGVHPYTAGFTNSFTYRKFHLNLLIDGKFGGSMFSGTNDMAYFLGTHKGTLPGRDEGVVGKGVKLDGSPNDKSVPAMEYYMYLANNISEAFVYDASFVKLRELSLGYSFPETVTGKLGLSQLTLSIVGRNLATLYDKVPMVDPESGYSSGNAQGLEQWGLPATRSWGFNLNVKF